MNGITDGKEGFLGIKDQFQPGKKKLGTATSVH